MYNVPSTSKGVISMVKRGWAEGKTPFSKVHAGFSSETLVGLI
jgi:hypothetical protein